MEIKISASNSVIDIISNFHDRNDPNAFTYGRILGMYLTGDGIGCQVNDYGRKAAIEKLGNKISEALLEYARQFPDSGIFKNDLVQSLDYSGSV